MTEIEKPTVELNQSEYDLIDFINTDDFKAKLEKISKEMNLYLYHGYNVSENVKQFFQNMNKRVLQSQEKLKILFEEAKRMLIAVFYLIDVIKEGSTHKEKNQYTNTAIQVIRKQIAHFEDMSNNEYIGAYFKDRSSIVLNYELIEEIKELKNNRKELQSEIKHLKDILKEE